MDEYGEVKGGESYPKINSFLRSRNHFISLMSETREYELFISINFQQHEVYKECLARFKGESNKNLKGEFTVSVKDAICITLSNKIVSFFEGVIYVIIDQENALPRGDSHFIVDYIIWRSFYHYHHRKRYEYLCTAEDHLKRVNIHASQKIMH